MKMDETQFSEQLRKLQEPSGPSRTWESPVFAMQDYESMTDSQVDYAWSRSQNHGFQSSYVPPHLLVL